MGDPVPPPLNPVSGGLDAVDAQRREFGERRTLEGRVVAVRTASAEQASDATALSSDRRSAATTNARRYVVAVEVSGGGAAGATGGGSAPRTVFVTTTNPPPVGQQITLIDFGLTAQPKFRIIGFPSSALAGAGSAANSINPATASGESVVDAARSGPVSDALDAEIESAFRRQGLPAGPDRVRSVRAAIERAGVPTRAGASIAARLVGIGAPLATSFLRGGVLASGGTPTVPTSSPRRLQDDATSSAATSGAGSSSDARPVTSSVAGSAPADPVPAARALIAFAQRQLPNSALRSEIVQQLERSVGLLRSRVGLAAFDLGSAERALERLIEEFVARDPAIASARQTLRTLSGDHHGADLRLAEAQFRSLTEGNTRLAAMGLDASDLSPGARHAAKELLVDLERRLIESNERVQEMRPLARELHQRLEAAMFVRLFDDGHADLTRFATIALATDGTDRAPVRMRFRKRRTTEKERPDGEAVEFRLDLEGPTLGRIQVHGSLDGPKEGHAPITVRVDVENEDVHERVAARLYELDDALRERDFAASLTSRRVDVRYERDAESDDIATQDDSASGSRLGKGHRDDGGRARGDGLDLEA